MLKAPPQVRLHPLLLFSSLSFPIHAIVTPIVGICSLWITLARILFAILLCMHFELNQSNTSLCVFYILLYFLALVATLEIVSPK